MSEPNTVKYDEFIKKAEVLVEALPYIQKFYGKSVVVKYGGNAMVNEELKNLVMQDIVLLKYIGMKPIIVHGGGPDISSTLKKFDVKSEFVNGLRVTDSFTRMWHKWCWWARPTRRLSKTLMKRVERLQV